MSEQDTAGRQLLGGVLAYPESWEQVRDRLAELDSSDAWLKNAWEVTADAHAKCPRPILPAFVERLECHRTLHDQTGLTDDDRAAIKQLHSDGQSFIDCESVHEHAERVALMRANQSAAKVLARIVEAIGVDPRMDALEYADAASAAIRRWYVGPRRIPVANMADLTRRVLASSAPTTIHTGFAAIDQEIGGLPIGQLTLVGARTGRGKTTFLTGLARNQAFAHASSRAPSDAARIERGSPGPYVLLISCENPSDMISERLACDMLDIDSDDMREHRSAAVDASPLAPSSAEYIAGLESHGRLAVIDQKFMGSISITTVCGSIRSWANAIKRADPDATMLVLVDYLQRIEPTATQAKEARHRQIELAAKALATLAKTHGLAIVAAEQLNDSADNTEPIRGDCRESKGANNEAGLVLLLHSWSASQRAALNAKFGRDAAQLRCMSVLCDKARTARDGWRAVLAFDGRHYRITDATAPTNYMLDSSTLSVAKGAKRPGRSSSN